jgi:putative ABC transport system permease protein
MGRLRFAARTLAKSPLLSLVVILSLGLGIGVNTAIFSLLYQVVLSALPVPHPEQLVLLTSPGNLKHGRTWDNNSGGQDYIFNWRAFREFEKHTEAATVAGFRTFGSATSYANETLRDQAMLVSGRYFQVMGVEPYLGRLITTDDDVPGAGNPVAVVAYRYWQEKLNGADILNHPIKINGATFTIVGIAPPGFTGTTVGDTPGVFVPMSFKPSLTEGWNGTDKLFDFWVYLIARVNPRVTRAQAEAALNIPYHAVVAEMAAESEKPEDRQPPFLNQKLTLKDGRQGNSDVRSDAAPALRIVMLATGLVLLIAMANAANLLLARSAERRKELVIRAALGAGRGELMSQFLTEAIVLAVAGGAAGIAIAIATLKLLISAIPDAQFADTGLNWPLLLFSVALSLATGILFGLYPAFDASRVSFTASIGDESGKTSGSRGAARFRKALVCAQLSISAILLIPTGLMLKSVVNLLHVDLGLQTANVIQFGITPQSNGYKPAQSAAIFERAESELAAIPGVRSAVGSVVPLIANDNWGTSFWLPATKPDAKRPNERFTDVGPHFFSDAGIPLIAGREILETDTATAPKVVVINQTFAKKYFANQNPIGQRIGFGKDFNLDTEIVGVVKDTHYSTVRRDPIPLFFRPWRQGENGSMTFYLRSALPAAKIMPEIRRVMQSIDRNVPIENLRTFDEQIHMNIRSEELMTRLGASFAILATILAMLGLYGVMAHGVARRTREIGIRMALGAAPRKIGSMILRELVWLLAIGLGIGIPAALAAARLIESQLFGVHSKDATIAATAAILLALTAASAAWWPARRAARVNPVDALRCE